MSTLAQRLRTAMERRRRLAAPGELINKAALARHCGVTQPSVGGWFDGSTHELMGANLLNAAAYLKVRPEWLAKGRGPMELPSIPLISGMDNIAHVAVQYRLVPLVSWPQVDEMKEVNDLFRQGETDALVGMESSSFSTYCFALKVLGDSMTSATGPDSFPDGTIIFIDPEAQPIAGKFVIAKDATTGKATFKRLMSDAGRWYLQPLNPTYPTLELDDPSLRVIGVVIEWRRGGRL